MDLPSLTPENDSEKVPPYADQLADTAQKFTVRENVTSIPPPQQYTQQQYVPQQLPQQQYVQQVPQQMFMNATPLSGLNMSSAPVDCPMCGVRSLTRMDFVAGSQTQYIPSSEHSNR